MRVWIDTDVGSDVDDALALAYALRHPQIELVGVSTVFGDVELRTRIAKALLERAGAADIPIVTGLGKPLQDDRQGVMFGHEGAGLLDSPSPCIRVEQDLGAEQRMDALAAALERTVPDVLVAIGPMTNIGALADMGVTLPPLCIMGGKIEDVTVRGMVAGISEWNWFCDPLAVQRTLALQHAVAPRIVPGEVTFRTHLREGDVERLAEGDPLAQTLFELSRVWLTTLRDQMKAEDPRVLLHDPLTVAVLVEPALAPFEVREIRVDDAGATSHVPGGAHVDVAVDVDEEGLREHLMQVWLA